MKHLGRCGLIVWLLQGCVGEAPVPERGELGAEPAETVDPAQPSQPGDSTDADQWGDAGMPDDSTGYPSGDDPASDPSDGGAPASDPPASDPSDPPADDPSDPPADDPSDPPADDPVDDPAPAEMPDLTLQNAFDLVFDSCDGCHARYKLDDSLRERILATANPPGMAYIEPGDPDNSYVWHKVNGTQDTVGGGGSVMPPSGPLPQENLDFFKAWIEAGAPE